MNWLLEGEDPKGILLYIDLGGPQRFISNSRKLSDLWISSYIASALAWRIFWIFIKSLGPDVMILPTCRDNPFYYHSLILELRRNGVNEAVIEIIKRISREITGYDPDKDKIPRYAVIPVTATFILPELEQLKRFDEFKEIETMRGLEEFVEKEYQKVWKSVYDKVIEKCEDLEIELGNLAIEVKSLLNKSKEFGFDKTPPLPIRVIALHTGRLYEQGLRRDERYSLYHYMFKLLGYEEGKRKLYKFRPEEDLKLFEMTSQPIKTWPKEADKGFEYCSVCGHLPAIIILPSNEDDYNNYLKRELEPIFGLGERLCPYCLIKRLMSIDQILESVLDELIGVQQKLPKLRFPSVSDIALIPFKKSFIMSAIKIDAIQELVNELNKWIEEIWEKFVEKRLIPIGREPITFIENKLLESIKNLKSDELKKNLEEIIFMDAEACFLKTYEIKENDKLKYYNPRRDWIKLKKRVYEHERMLRYLEKEKIEDLNTYYTIVRCDGDNLSKIIRGKVEDGFGITVKDYLCNALEGAAKEVVEAIINNEHELARKICEEHKVKEIDNKINEISRFINELQEKKEIIVSPSYHSTLSRALMSNAVRDKEIIDKHDGLTIYAGGDDLLAITPVKNSLSAAQELREKFSFPSAKKGFDIKNGYLIPSLVTASRSFSLYITHYMFPMYSAIGRSAELLDDRAKESEWIVNTKRKKKDTLILSYSPRGGEYYSLLPLSDLKTLDHEQHLAKSLDYIDKLVSHIERNEFSSSLIYDLYNNLQTIKLLINENNKTLLERVIKRVFERNCEIRDKQRCEEIIERWTQRLIEDYDISVKVNDCSKPFLEQFFLALILYRSGLRGVE
ncbi:MAG: type III-B CRISPR-associated protein Cas10/Cmr2 [Nitrososphaerota archaeon]|nr:type III-B CRISPR-associated protein Cas10/Cmr2 [Nitrososphaerota archaeon]